MPTEEQTRARRKRLQNALIGRNPAFWKCPRCSRLIIDMRGGRASHEKRCKVNTNPPSPPPPPPLPPPLPLPLLLPLSPPPVDYDVPILDLNALDLEAPPSPTDLENIKRTRSGLRKPPAPVVAKPLGDDSGQNDAGALSEPESLPSNADSEALGAEEWDNRETVPQTLEEGEVWIRQHPDSGLESGFQGANLDPLPHSQTPRPSATAVPDKPPHHPFKTQDDFDQAHILIKYGASDDQITEQLQLNLRRLKDQGDTEGIPKNARELHQLLATAAPAEHLTFDIYEIATYFKTHSSIHHVRTRSLWQAVVDPVEDPELANDLVYLPSQRFVRSRTSSKPTQTLEEPWHGKDWWDAQTRIGPGGRALWVQVYVDATHLSTAGGAKVWPVYGWLGNVPAALRKGRGKGGAALIGYLPVVEEDKSLNSSDMAEVRVHVYHEAWKKILESIELAAKEGKLVRCGDGVVRLLFLVLGAISADYEELMKLLALLGAKSGFPCPLCLVPREQQGDLSGRKWPLRTYEGTMNVHEQAAKARTATAAQEIRREQSLRKTQAWPYSIYSAIAAADPLHQIEQGVFGKHLWPKLIAMLGQRNCGILDQRFKDIPAYPDLKHFPNGVTGLKNVQGYEHATILRLLAPLIEDLIADEYQETTLKTIRALARIHFLIKLTTQTDETLELLEEQTAEFGSLWQEFSSLFETDEEYSDVSANYPKLHSLVHAPDILRRKSTTDNYHTGLGEGQHPQSKTDYSHTNRQLGYEDQVRTGFRLQIVRAEA
ncbi:hypothetical protein FRC09_005626 [Ceratobasidium sp. 395]|nr:hypothetical protein FRC09_005626 [Ceratobasidium sp. 395]